MKQCSFCDWFHDLEGYNERGYCGCHGIRIAPHDYCRSFAITPLDYPEDDHIIDEILIEEWHIHKGLWETVDAK